MLILRVLPFNTSNGHIVYYGFSDRAYRIPAKLALLSHFESK